MSSRLAVGRGPEMRTHGGASEVASARGRGRTFQVLLPGATY